MKKIFVFLTMCCLMIGAFAQTAPVAKAVKNPGDTIDCSSFKAAVDTLNKYNGGTILVCADDSIADKITIDKPMTIKAFGGNYTIKAASAFNADMAFLIKKSLTLGEDGSEHTLTFDGNQKTPNQAFFYCSNPSDDAPSLTLKGGVYITKCSSTVACMTSGCNLNITGNVLIDNCTCNSLFFTWESSKVTMTNGKIENNTVTTCIFMLKGNAQLSGGAIQNNTYTGENASAIISENISTYGYENSNFKLQDSIFIGDTVRLIAGNNFRVQLETVNELTKHSADNPIVVKVDYIEDRQILTGDAANILANYKKFKPVDVNGKNVCIDKEGRLREYKFFSIATGTTDTVGHFTLKAAVDTLNNHGGGKVLADYGEVLTETVNVNSDIQILARGADVTFTRGESLTNGSLINVNNSLTVGESKNDLYRVIFDGDSIATTASLLYNNVGGLHLKGKVWIKNSKNASAIYNNGGNLSIYGEAHFENNTAEKGGAINSNADFFINDGATVVFMRDSAENGGAIYNDEGSVYIAANTEVRFVENHADVNGGAIYHSGYAQIQSENAIVFFEGNKAQNGGAIYLNTDLYISITAFNFKDNRATENGGAIYIKERSFSFDFAPVIFDGDSATNGGAIYNDEGKLNIFSTSSIPVAFNGNKATNGGAIYSYNSGSTNISSESKVDFSENIATENGGAIYNGNYCTFVCGEESILSGIENQAQYGAAIYNEGRVESNGTMNLDGNIATRGGIIYNTDNYFNFTAGSIGNNVVKYTADDDNQSDNGVVVVKGGDINLNGGIIEDNIFVNESGHEMDTLPASLVYDASKTGIQQIKLKGSAFVDTIRLLLRGDYEKNIEILEDNDLTVASEENPIVLIVDTLDKQIMYNGYANNYKKFKPAADTLDVNNQGWLVRKPQISVDGIYLLQAGTLYEDYGVTTSTGEVDEDKIYVEYTQNVDAHGSDNITTSDSTIIEMTVTAGEAVSNLRQKIADSQNNGRYGFAVPFSNTALSGVDLTSGTYTVKIDTLVVHTLGIAAGTGNTLEKDVNIPTFTIDTLNFLLAGTMFSDYHYCGVGAATNDGDGNDVVPGDEIYVQYQREGAIDTAYITVEVTGNDQTVIYKENTPASTHLEAGCGSFRSFLDNTGIGQFTPSALILVDDSTYTCKVNIHVKAEGDPYFATASKTFTYKHDIDRSATFALDTANDRDENYHKIGIALNNINDSLALTYPSVFSVAKANELGMIDNTDHCVYVVLTADPEDTVLRVESANQAKNLLTDVALNSSNYSTAGYGVQDGKLLMAVKVSEPVAENAVVVPAINFVTDSVLRWCSAIGANTGVNNPYKTFRTFYKVSGETAHDTTKVAYTQMSYRKTGVSGVELHATNGQASYIFHPEDYTVWNTQNPTPGLNLDGKVWLALYVAAPNANVKQVYSHPATNTPSGEISSIVTLADDLEKRVTATEAVNYYPVGTCADYNTKDYTFYSTGDAPYLNNYLYWFDENSKLLSVQKYDVSVKKAPIYSVNFNFHGGGATCNTPYSETFADTTYVFGRPIVRPENPFKCGNLFMDWRHGVDSFTVDSFKNIRAGISEATGQSVAPEPFGIRSNMIIDAAWKYFVTLHNPHDTAVVADYSLCEINTRDYVWEPTEATFPYVYEFHTDYLGSYYRDYLESGNANCNIRFDANAFTEIPAVLPVGQTSLLRWRVTDLCGYQLTISQNVNVKFPPCGADNYNPHLYPFTPYVDSTYKAIDQEGNLYETVRMGCDCWTKENLKSLQYDGGSEIAVAQAYLNNEDKVDEYGRLYTWYSAVNLPENSNETVAPLNADGKPQGVCPSGWYLPSEDDFARMSNLDNIQGASVGIKTDGSNNYWLGHEVGDNSTGFTAKPAGYYDATTNRYYNELGDTYFWSSSSTSTVTAPCCALTHSCPSILIQDNSKWYGYSVRCIKYRKFDY